MDKNLLLLAGGSLGSGLLVGNMTDSIFVGVTVGAVVGVTMFIYILLISMSHAIT